MGLSDKLKDLRRTAEDAVVEHKDQIHQTVQKVGEAADQHTGGKYTEKIQQAGAKASGFVDGLAGDEPPPAEEGPAEGEAPPPPA